MAHINEFIDYTVETFVVFNFIVQIEMDMVTENVLLVPDAQHES